MVFTRMALGGLIGLALGKLLSPRQLTLVVVAIVIGTLIFVWHTMRWLGRMSAELDERAFDYELRALLEEEDE